MDFDRVLEKCGNYNRYQLILMLVFGYTNILSSMHYFAQTITTFTPEHWCHHPDLENRTFEEIRDIYAVFESPSCTVLENVDGNETRNEDFGRCTKWIYNYESGYESISTELNWVCDKRYQSAVGQSFFFVGSVVGTILFGFLADKIGRLPALILSSVTGGIGDFVTSFIGSVQTFALGRFISGLSTDTMFYLMYIMVFEYLRPSKRTFGLNITTILFYTVGMVCSPWLAIWIGNWRLYLRVASVPIALMVLYPFVICESAQWLITQNRMQDAVKCLKRVAKVNGRKVEDIVFEQFEAHYTKKHAEEKQMGSADSSFMGMFRTPRLRKFTIILLIKSMIITLAFDVTGRNVEGLGTSPFKLFSYTSLVYIPAGFTIILFQNIIGRKGMACGSLFIGGLINVVSGFLIAFLDHNEYSLLLAFIVGLSRYGSIVAYDAEAQYAAEIIPTSVRGRGVANVHVVGYGFNFLSSYIIFLSTFFKPLPSIFISIIMLAGAVLCLALPETLNKKLPETLAEGEEFGKDEKWYYFPCLGDKDPDIEITKL